MLKVLGFIDILLAIFLFLTSFIIIKSQFLLLFAFYLIIKGLFFLFGTEPSLSSLANVGDIAVGVMFYLATSFTIPKILISLGSLFMIQKGLVSFI